MTDKEKLYAIMPLFYVLISIGLVRIGIHLALHDHPWWAAFVILWGIRYGVYEKEHTA